MSVEAKLVFGAWFNLGGLSATKPLKLRFEENIEEENGVGVFWVNEGSMKDEMSFELVGLDIGDGCIRFCSENKAEVEAFIIGVRAAHSLQSVPRLIPTRGKKR